MSILSSLYGLMDKVKYLFENTSFVKGGSHKYDNKDLQLIYDIQPTGNIKFRDNYAVLGDGYMACIHVYTCPSSVGDNWMINIMSIPQVIGTIDVETLDANLVKENINRTLNEYESRITDPHQNKRSVEKEAIEAYNRVDALLDDIRSLKNSMKALHIRLFLYGRTFEELQEAERRTMQILEAENFLKYGINVNEVANEYKSFFLPISIQNKTLSARKGIPSPSRMTALTLPYHYVGWTDPYGFYIGDTPEVAGNGVVMFYPYTIDRNRTSYDGIIFGKKGTGKSTFIKMMIEWQIATGNKVRIIDVTGETRDITEHYGGIVLTLDGSKGRLNPLEILRTENDDALNYMNHIAKISTMFQLKNPDVTQDVVDLFKVLLKDVYIAKGIVRVNEFGETDYRGITGLPPEVYPIFSDVKRAIKRKISVLEKEAKDKESSRLIISQYIQIKATVDDICDNYGKMFDGYTTIGNMMDADIICFDIKSVSNMEDTIFDMQLFNVLSMAYDSCMDIGIQMKKKWDRNQISERDIIHHTIYIDECHKTINAYKKFAVRRILDIMRQDRKYFIGVWLATQNVADMFPESKGISSELKTLFSLCQYKVIFKQDEKAIELINTVFGEQITPKQLNQISKFGKRDCLLNFDIITLQMQIKLLSDEKLKYFGGGA